MGPKRKEPTRHGGGTNTLPSGTLTSGTHAIATTLGLALLGCHAAPPAPEPRDWADLETGARPSLEEIFLEPPIHGEAPEIEGLSPDGEWLLYSWESDGASLRLVSTTERDPEHSDGRALDAWLGLAEETEASEDDSGLDSDDETEDDGPWTWGFEGARLAVARAQTVHLLEPGGDSLRVFLELRAPEEPADAEDSAEDSEPELDIQSLAFARDGRSLRAFIDGELYAFPLTGTDWPLALGDGRHVSRDIESDRWKLQWSEDLGVVFGAAAPPVPAQEEKAEEEEALEADEDATGEASAQAEPFQVWHVTEARGVTLAAMADLPALESTALSPDGRFVFGAAWDRSGEPESTLVPDYLSERVTTRSGRKLLADDGPSFFELWMWDTDTGERSALLPEEAAAEAELDPDLEEEVAADPKRGPWWLRRIGWAPQRTDGAPARFAFQRVSADFHDLEIWVWTEGELACIWRDHDEHWIGGPVRSRRWNHDGTRLLLASESTPDSTTPGRCQLFSVDPVTGASTQLTALEGELRSFFPLPSGGVIFSGSGSDPARLGVGKLAAEDLTATARTALPAPLMFPTPPGWNAGVRASRAGQRIVFTHEELLRPLELWTADEHGARPLTDSVPEAFESIDWIKPERIEVLAADGALLHAHVYLPPGVSLPSPNGPPRPTIFFVHGAGYLQNVTDSMTEYPLNMLFHSRLASMGYPVVDVDYRGSMGYGNAFRTELQYHLGGLDLDDIHAVLDHLVSLKLIDPERVGLYGGSYGGFLTMMALFTAPERWSVGAALRSVTDWRTYHPGYTVPRLGRPSTHAEAYERSSPIDLFNGLEDPLLILHGMRDSNVFAQDSIRLIEELIDHGKDFEAMLYPSQGHGFVDGPHWLDEYRRIERFLLRHLGPAPR